MERDNPAAAEAGIEAPATVPWVVFACAGRRLALPLARIQEILTPRPFTRLPGSGRAVAGLIGVRSRVITAWDLGLLLGSEPAAAIADHRVLLLEAGSRTVGLVVDEVYAVAGLPLEDEATGGLVVGAADWDGARVEALGVEALLERALAPDPAR